MIRIFVHILQALRNREAVFRARLDRQIRTNYNLVIIASTDNGMNHRTSKPYHIDREP